MMRRSRSTKVYCEVASSHGKAASIPSAWRSILCRAVQEANSLCSRPGFAIQRIILQRRRCSLFDGDLWCGEIGTDKIDEQDDFSIAAHGCAPLATQNTTPM